MQDFLIITIIIVMMSFFVMAEVALLTSAKYKLHKKIEHNDFGAKQALKLMQIPEIFLSTVQVGITLLSLILGTLTGNFLGEYITELFLNIQIIQEYSHAIGYFISFGIMTYLSVLFEIVPKRIAMLYPEITASFFSYPVTFCVKLFYPIVFLLTKSVKFCIRLIHLDIYDNKVSVDEIKFLVNQAAVTGTLTDTEKYMMRRLANIGDMLIGAIMSHRNQIIALDLSKKVEFNIKLIKKYRFNYFPVINKDFSNFIGFLEVKNLILKHTDHNKISNKEIEKSASASKIPILYMPEIAKVTDLIKACREKNTKIAMVIDEYGDIEGIVTFSDVIRTFMGDIGNIVLQSNRKIIKTQNGESYIADGNALIEEIMEQLNLQHLKDDETEDYRTLASFILKQLGTIPKNGDYFMSSGWKFTVTKMDKFRIDKVRISKVDLVD